jgi:hypothetical protein
MQSLLLEQIYYNIPSDFVYWQDDDANNRTAKQTINDNFFLID